MLFRSTCMHGHTYRHGKAARKTKTKQSLKTTAYRGLADAACRRASAALNERRPDASVAECIEFSLGTDPTIRRRMPWKAVRFKQMVGPFAASTLARLIRTGQNGFRRLRRSDGRHDGLLGSTWMPSLRGQTNGPAIAKPNA